MGKRYDDALARFMRDCGNPSDPKERARIEDGFSDTLIAAQCRLQDAWSALFEPIRAYREFYRISAILRGFTDQDRKETNMLKFEDYYAGSGRANIEGGFYLVMPQIVGYKASRSNGKEWVWEGGSFDTADLAQAACQAHFLGKGMSPHPENPDNYWISDCGGEIICAHCSREYPADGEDAFDPSKEKCSDDCPQYDGEKL